MKRIVKKHDERKHEILDTAQALFYKYGYENTSITNVIETVNIAKGTFYHYFKSKTELLDQIIERVARHIDILIAQVLQEPEENAIIELNHIFHEIGQYKAQEKEVMIMMTRALYNDNNIILRTKLTEERIKTVVPPLAKIIARGISEGLFHTGDPENMAELILSMGTSLRAKFAEYVLNDQLNDESKKKYITLCIDYERSVEHMLGAPKSSINLIGKEVIAEFFN